MRWTEGASGAFLKWTDVESRMAQVIFTSSSLSKYMFAAHSLSMKRVDSAVADTIRTSR